MNNQNNPQEVPQVKSVEETEDDNFWSKQIDILKMKSRIAELEVERDRYREALRKLFNILNTNKRLSWFDIQHEMKEAAKALNSKEVGKK